MINKQYCSFSQSKGLLYSDWFDRILKKDFKPPIGVGVDLTDACNIHCVWCNAESYRSSNTLKTADVFAIVDSLAAWGVKSVCYAGGGEPSCHKDFGKILQYSAESGLEVGMSTNGVALKPEDIATIAKYCRFCGVSFDAGLKETWERIKGSNLYDRLIENCKSLATAALDTDLDLTFKMIIAEGNQYEILTACKLAKSLKFKNFFARPVAFENIPHQSKEITFDIAAITEQMSLIQKEETDDFKVFGNFGRVDKNLHKLHNYPKCRATPLFAMFCADGNCYLCIDYRERDYGLMCKHSEIREFWNTPAHHNLIEKIDLNNCPRCTFGNYNEQIDHYVKDTFFRWFP